MSTRKPPSISLKAKFSVTSLENLSFDRNCITLQNKSKKKKAEEEKVRGRKGRKRRMVKRVKKHNREERERTHQSEACRIKRRGYMQQQKRQITATARAPDATAKKINTDFILPRMIPRSYRRRACTKSRSPV